MTYAYTCQSLAKAEGEATQSLGFLARQKGASGGQLSQRAEL